MRISWVESNSIAIMRIGWKQSKTNKESDDVEAKEPSTVRMYIL